MFKDISIKELRKQLSDVADRAEQGESFRIIRRSKPSFVIMKVDADASEEGWETVVDFTDGGKKAGMPINDVVKIIKKIRR
jgi:prevent-host-death family protein